MHFLLLYFLNKFILCWFVFSQFYVSSETHSSNELEEYSTHLATKTPYRFVANVNDGVISYPECVPSKIYMVIRHGTRNPSKKLIDKMRNRLPVIVESIKQNRHEENQGILSSSDLSKLLNWNPLINLEEEKLLTHEGEDEMIELAERFQSRFPELLPADYSNSSYKFRSTLAERTKQSMFYFATGLFGRNVAKYVWTPEPLNKDPILRFYKLCSKWRQEVDKNPDSLTEKIKFQNSTHMAAVVQQVSQTLGLDDLTLDDINLMYMTCCFETAWHKNKKSPWCSIFTPESFKALEFAQDLEYYWVDGYGYNITYQQACPLIRDMFKHFMYDDEPSRTFYFTHSGTILKVLAHLGLYKDNYKLRHDTFNQDRLWRVGWIDPFAANLAFVLFECENEELKLLTLHQERVVTLPGCPTSEDLCPFLTVLRNFARSFYKCRFDEMCGNI